ncbi:MAG: hypothetical protein AAGF46_05295, partial [Pseudomonadota bacterium]
TRPRPLMSTTEDSEPRTDQSALQRDPTGQRRAGKNLIVGWIAKLSVVISGFVLPRLISDTLGAVQLGIWDFGWSLVAYFRLLGLGLATGLNRYVARYDASGETLALRRVVASAATIQLIVCAVTLLVGFVVALNIQHVFRLEDTSLYRDAATLAMLFTAMLAMRMLSWPARGILTGRHLWATNSSLTAWGDFLALAAAVVVLLVFEAGLVALGTAYLSATVLTESLRMLLARREFAQPIYALKFSYWPMMKKLVTFGLKSNLIGMNQMVVVQTLRIVLFNAIGPAALATYARPQSLLRFANTFVYSYATLLTPTASSLQGLDRQHEMKAFFLSSVRITAALALPMCLALGVYGDLVIATWMGSDYVVPWLMATVAAGGFLSATHPAATTIMAGLNQHGRMALQAAAVTLTLFALGVTLGYAGGWTPVRAAAVGGVSLSVGCGLFYAWFACRALKINLTEYLGQVYAVPVSCNVLFLALLLLPQWLGYSHTFLSMLIWSGLAATLLGALYWQFLLTPDTRQRVIAKIPFLKPSRTGA